MSCIGTETIAEVSQVSGGGVLPHMDVERKSQQDPLSGPIDW